MCNSLNDDIEPDKVTEYETKKSAPQEAVTEMTCTVADLKACRKATPRHMRFADLPPEDRFRMLSMKGKYFIDTIKLIAYRAETANIVRHTLRRQDDVRSLLRGLYATEADTLPDHEAKTLTVRLHQPVNRYSRVTILHLIGELNVARMIFPGTDLRQFYELVSRKNLARSGGQNFLTNFVF